MKSAFSRLLIVTALFSLMSCGSGTGSGSSPGDIVKTMIKDLAEGNNDALITSSVNKKGESLSKEEQEFMKAFAPEVKKDMDKKDGLKEVVIIEESISEDGNTATVTYELIWGNGDKSDKSETKLMKVDGKWRPLFELGK
jgi:Domain of unknown function (DUF4878)